MLYIVGSYHCMQFQRKLMNQSRENGKKKQVSGLILAPLAQIWAPIFFSWILALLDVRHYCKLSLNAISSKTNKLNLRKWQKKTSFGPYFCPFGPNSGRYFFPQKSSFVSHYISWSAITMYNIRKN